MHFAISAATIQASEDPNRISEGDIPLYAAPTHFGTGSEVNGDAILVENVTGEYLPLCSEFLKPNAVFVDEQNFAGLSVSLQHRVRTRVRPPSTFCYTKRTFACADISIAIWCSDCSGSYSVRGSFLSWLEALHVALT